MWPLLIVLAAFALPSLAQIFQTATIRTLIPPGESIGFGKYMSGPVENVYGFIQYCHICRSISPRSRPWMLLTPMSNSFLEENLKIAAEKNVIAFVLIADNVLDSLQPSYDSVLSTLMKEYNNKYLNIPIIIVTEEHGSRLVNISQVGGNVPVIIEPGRKDGYERSSFMVLGIAVLLVVTILGICYAMYQRKESSSPIIIVCPYQKAVSKIPTQELSDTQELVSDGDFKCAICLDGFQVKEIVSHLPCKHIFHKECIEPWLYEKRLCPMCKMDIVRFYGHVNVGSVESIVDIPFDGDNVSVSTTVETEEDSSDEENKDS